MKEFKDLSSKIEALNIQTETKTQELYNFMIGKYIYNQRKTTRGDTNCVDHIYTKIIKIEDNRFIGIQISVRGGDYSVGCGMHITDCSSDCGYTVQLIAKGLYSITDRETVQGAIDLIKLRI